MPSGAKALVLCGSYGTAEAVPFQRANAQLFNELKGRNTGHHIVCRAGERPCNSRKRSEFAIAFETLSSIAYLVPAQIPLIFESKRYRAQRSISDVEFAKNAMLA